MGAIGLLLPVWPTTPFVLVSVACFSSAPRVRCWINKNPFFKAYIESYEHKAGLSRKTVWISIVWLWGMLFLSMFLIHRFRISVFLFLVGAAVTTHILWMANVNRGKKAGTE